MTWVFPDVSNIKIHNGSPTVQHILDILACSPALEVLELTHTELVPTPIDTNSPKLRLPLLKSLTITAVFATPVEPILDRIAVDPDTVTRIDIHLYPDIQIFNASHFLTETLAPFAPVFRRLNKHCDGSTLEIRRREDFIWKSKSRRVHSFEFGLRGIGMQAFLPWLEQAVGTDDFGVSLLLDLPPIAPVDTRSVSTLGKSRIITGMEILLRFGPSLRGQDVVLDAVSRIEEAGDGQAGIVAIPSFPSLQTILFDGWTDSLDGIEETLRKRFAKRAMMKALLPDLLVEISYRPINGRVANSSEGILAYDDTHRIRTIDGVRDFRIRDGEEYWRRSAGILAVVWCESSSRAVWG